MTTDVFGTLSRKWLTSSNHLSRFLSDEDCCLKGVVVLSSPASLVRPEALLAIAQAKCLAFDHIQFPMRLAPVARRAVAGTIFVRSTAAQIANAVDAAEMTALPKLTVAHLATLVSVWCRGSQDAMLYSLVDQRMCSLFLAHTTLGRGVHD